jgi:type VI protein secretion system component VasK
LPLTDRASVNLRKHRARIGVAVVAVAAVAVSLVVIWNHRHDAADAAARTATIEHSRSYIYGERAFDRVMNRTGLPIGSRAYCRAAFRLHPPRFVSYNVAFAMRGCLDETNAVDR